MTIARHVRATGQVQGVFFRAWTRDQARQLGVKGWVRNCDDGSVEAKMEGDEADMKAVIARMRPGPSARVERVEIQETTPDSLCGFEVRH